MKFKLWIDIENDAFQRDCTEEIGSILINVATRIQLQSVDDIKMYQTIVDSNGNDVGRYGVKNDDTE